MREIKFRGISEETGEFIFGYLSSNVESFYIGTHGENYRFDEVKKESIGQFTGLYDKNGEKVFEGDILKKSWLAKEEKGFIEHFIIGLVECKANVFGITMKIKGSTVDEKTKDPFWHRNRKSYKEPYKKPNEETYFVCTHPYVNFEDFEIIGNIHQNPELLK